MRYQTKDLIIAAGFGWLCGMRSMAGPAVAGRRLLKDRRIANALAIGAAGEMLADKYPKIPNRNSPPPLAARTISGALTGAAIVVSGTGWRRGLPIRSRSHRLMRADDTLAAAAVGAVIGGSVAFVSTHVSYHLRRMISKEEIMPDAAVGATEDAIVYGAAALLSQSLG